MSDSFEDEYLPSEERLEQLSAAYFARQARIAEADEVCGVPSARWLHAARRARVEGHLAEAEWLLKEMCEAARRVQRVRPRDPGRGGSSIVELAKLYRKTRRFHDEVSLYESMCTSPQHRPWPAVEKARARAGNTVSQSPVALSIPFLDEGVFTREARGEVLLSNNWHPLTLVLHRRTPTLTFQSGLVLTADTDFRDTLKEPWPDYFSSRQAFYFTCEEFTALVRWVNQSRLKILERYSSRQEASVVGGVESMLTGAIQPGEPSED